MRVFKNRVSQWLRMLYLAAHVCRGTIVWIEKDGRKLATLVEIFRSSTDVVDNVSMVHSIFEGACNVVDLNSIAEKRCLEGWNSDRFVADSTHRTYHTYTVDGETLFPWFYWSGAWVAHGSVLSVWKRETIRKICLNQIRYEWETLDSRRVVAFSFFFIKVFLICVSMVTFNVGHTWIRCLPFKKKLSWTWMYLFVMCGCILRIWNWFYVSNKITPTQTQI